MRGLSSVILDLEEWNQGATCRFCNNFGRRRKIAICQIRTRSESTDKLVDNHYACEECKEKFLNNKLSRCESCSRLQTDLNIDINIGKYICDCVKYKEELDDEEEKELPSLPGTFSFYERQINDLREKERELTEEVDAHLEALEISEDWHKRQKQEFLDRIKELEEENKRLKELTPQELITEINELKAQLAKFQQQNLTAQIEVKETKKWPWKKK